MATVYNVGTYEATRPEIFCTNGPLGSKPAQRFLISTTSPWLTMYQGSSVPFSPR